MIIYAIFFCVQMSGSCRLIGPTGIHIDGQPVMTSTFTTLAQCERALAHYISGPPRNGRYYAGPGMWYECDHKHVDTWQSQ